MTAFALSLADRRRHWWWGDKEGKLSRGYSQCWSRSPCRIIRSDSYWLWSAYGLEIRWKLEYSMNNWISLDLCKLSRQGRLQDRWGLYPLLGCIFTCQQFRHAVSGPIQPAEMFPGAGSAFETTNRYRFKQGVAIAGRNTTGPPSRADPWRRPGVLQTTTDDIRTTTTDAREQTIIPLHYVQADQ